jgi:hypothetical protein
MGSVPFIIGKTMNQYELVILEMLIFKIFSAIALKTEYLKLVLVYTNLFLLHTLLIQLNFLNLIYLIIFFCMILQYADLYSFYPRFKLY